MPRYIKYPVLTFLAAAAVYFAGSLMGAPEVSGSALDTPRPASEAPQPNYLITDGNVRPQ